MFWLCVVLLGQVLGEFRGPPMVDQKQMLLDSFIPASMQIIAHITELMKFDLRPSTGGTTTTTLRPTRAHKPGIHAPDKPPGPESYFASQDSSYLDYVQRLKSSIGLERLFPKEDPASNVPQDLDEDLGKHFSDFLRLVSTVEDVDEAADKDEQVQDFSEIYDDSNFRFLLLRQKKQPPTRAYVTLLSLYDLLNKESKKLGLNKYNGYTDSTLKQLVEMSTGTSGYQLKAVLSKILSRQDTKNPQILRKINELLKDLEETSSYLNAALRYIPPLSFIL